jgi:hypothetical protein
MKDQANPASATRRNGILAMLTVIGSALMLPTGALAVVPSDGGGLSLTVYPISLNAAVDSYDPHVSGDLVSYTADSTVRYYDFFTGTDRAVPPGFGSTDLLSDVSGERIAFTRVDGSGARIRVYDTTNGTMTDVSPHGSSHFFAALGSDTVAFIDQNVGILHAGHLGGPLPQVTDGSRIDQSPQAAPQGDLVVYESCPAQDPLNCDVHQAAWNGTTWATASLTSTPEREAYPDTDGSVVVYEADRTDARDIAWQPVGGGGEQVLELPGDQRNPSISAGVISFESAPTPGGAADMFVYEIASGRLFRITTTSADDSLNDISKGVDGRYRLVWSAESGANRDVHGVTFEIQPVAPTYSFGGFQQPVDARPTLNSMKAGVAVPVKFSLGGDRGLDIFSDGYPRSESIACDSSADVDGIEQTVAAGGSALTFDALTDLYSYVWKTDKTWAGKCRQLVLAFSDGSVARANFKFK